jgi:hypothetical protein
MRLHLNGLAATLHFVLPFVPNSSILQISIPLGAVAHQTQHLSVLHYRSQHLKALEARQNGRQDPYQ